MLEKLRESVLKWRQEVDKLEATLEAKLQRLEYLQTSPLPADEVADVVVNAMLAHGKRDFHNHLDRKLDHAVRHPLADAESQWRPDLLSKLGQPTEANVFSLVWILRDRVAEALRREIVESECLPEGGPPKAERLTEIPKLERDIQKLRQRIETERTAAKDAGVDLAQIHARPPTPARTRDLKR